MTTDSDEILFKKRARRRLVGAVVFASVVAIALPMLMDENPNPKIDDILVRIPPPAPRTSTSAKPKSATPALDDLMNRTSPPAEWSQNPPLPEVPQMPQETDFPAIPEINLNPAKTPSAAPNTAQKQSQNQPIKTPTTKNTEKQKTPSRREILAAQRAAAERESRSSSESARVAAILEGRDETSRTVAGRFTTGGGRFLIALGTFSNAANVKNLTNKLNALGVPNYTENLPNQQIRVRAGPFASNKAAEDAHAKMGANGVDGKIIKAQ